ncbi:hypothetical protein JCM19240_4033 [Vibrio maritimus]|uniref:Uncharacterized protein n=1 Tax=Vibrio maritimus TaxID=990268 RepID=A0A090T5M2_9VIBR|nr:hypothetical protein JCM19240_4033 [Vibrio maritimus]
MLFEYSLLLAHQEHAFQVGSLHLQYGLSVIFAVLIDNAQYAMQLLIPFSDGFKVFILASDL